MLIHLFVSLQHGMGMPSIAILLHELIKLMYHAGVKNPLFFRLGTCGGLGVEPGSVVVTTEALNGQLEPFYKMVRTYGLISGWKTFEPVVAGTIRVTLYESGKNCLSQGRKKDVMTTF
jgi:uridine phosphorylase